MLVILPSVPPTGTTPSSAAAPTPTSGHTRAEADSDGHSGSPFSSLLQALLVTPAAVPVTRTDVAAVPSEKTPATPSAGAETPATPGAVPALTVPAKTSAGRTAASPPAGATAESAPTAANDVPGGNVRAAPAAVSSPAADGVTRAVATTPTTPPSAGSAAPAVVKTTPPAPAPASAGQPAVPATAPPANPKKAPGAGSGGTRADLPAGATLVAATVRPATSAQPAQTAAAGPAEPGETPSSVKNSSPAPAPAADLPEEKVAADAPVVRRAPADLPGPTPTRPAAPVTVTPPDVAPTQPAPAVTASTAPAGKTAGAANARASAATAPAKNDSRPSNGGASGENAARLATTDGRKSGDIAVTSANAGQSPRQGTATAAAATGGSGLPAAGPVSAAKAAPAGSPPAATRGSPPVAEQVAAGMVSRAQLAQRGGTTEFYVRLEPPELGTVHVHLQASEGNVTAKLVVESEAARSALQAQLPDLRTRLGSAGVNLGGLDVSQRQAGSGQAGGRGSDTPQGQTVPAATAAAAQDTGPVYVPAADGAVNVIA